MTWARKLYRHTGGGDVPVLSVVRAKVLYRANPDAFDSNVRRWKCSRSRNVAAVRGAAIVAGYHELRKSWTGRASAVSQEQ